MCKLFLWINVFVPSQHIGVELLDQMVALCLTMRNYGDNLTISSAIYESFNFSTFLPTLIFPHF